ncbi:hypothetical protein HanRHA438_Chr17g0809911 [Helianthus annuus]|nr:hypothetical protein HanIR_Chr17g0867421 [Helianthus annuus]KAJ0826050.1 hypothetical protein HanRHA438_Chr17g0809911 [Helianthus annuus]
MGEPACLMRSFSYNHTRIPSNQMMQGNYAHGLGPLGGCYSTVEFMSDSSGCEKWSNVSKKCYVEEAKSYTQPGSVAEKKAFFDAYYKKIAAQKAAAAALLEQEKAAAAAAAAAAAEAQRVTSKVVDLVIDNNIGEDTKNTDSLNFINLEVYKKERPLLKSKPDADKEVRRSIITKKPASSSWVASTHHKKDKFSTPSVNSTPKRAVTPMRTPAKAFVNGVNTTPKRAVTPMKTPAKAFVNGVNSTPKRAVTPTKTPAKAFVNGTNSTPKRTVSPLKTPAKAFVNGVNSTPKRAVTPMRTPSMRTPAKAYVNGVNSTPKRAVTPMKTPAKAFVNGVNSTPKRAVTPMKTPAKTFVNGVNKQPSVTLSVDRSSESFISYTSKLKSPTISSPFVLRTDDRAARRKQFQMLEEKFNEKQAKVVPQKAQFKEKAGSEFRTTRESSYFKALPLSESSYFKALPLPDFYNGRGTPEKILEAIQIRSHYEKHPRRF